MVLIGKSLNERRAAQVERRVACAASAAAGRASSASPVPLDVWLHQKLKVNLIVVSFFPSCSAAGGG